MLASAHVMSVAAVTRRASWDPGQTALS